MYNFLHDMGALSLQNRTIGLIENNLESCQRKADAAAVF